MGEFILLDKFYFRDDNDQKFNYVWIEVCYCIGHYSFIVQVYDERKDNIGLLLR